MSGYLALATPFLQSVQNVNNKDVNDALNEVYLEAEEFELLRESVQNYDNFDQLGLARQTQGHELTEFRRIAAFLYRYIISSLFLGAPKNSISRSTSASKMRSTETQSKPLKSPRTPNSCKTY
jgi:hypothetical protein